MFPPLCLACKIIFFLTKNIYFLFFSFGIFFFQGHWGRIYFKGQILILPQGGAQKTWIFWGGGGANSFTKGGTGAKFLYFFFGAGFLGFSLKLFTGFGPFYPTF